MATFSIIKDGKETVIDTQSCNGANVLQIEQRQVHISKIPTNGHAVSTLEIRNLVWGLTKPKPEDSAPPQEQQNPTPQRNRKNAASSDSRRQQRRVRAPKRRPVPKERVEKPLPQLPLVPTNHSGTEIAQLPIKEVWQIHKEEPNVATRNRLIEKYSNIVKYQSDRYWNKIGQTVDINDLRQEAIFGLMDAIRLFDLKRGLKFETYCVPRIIGSMQDWLRNMDFVPRLLRPKMNRRRDAIKTLVGTLGRNPTPTEIAYEMKITHEDYEALMLEMQGATIGSLEHERFETGSFKMVATKDLLPDKEAPDPQNSTGENEFWREMCRGLSKHERLIVLLYYREGLRMKEIGRHIGVSESRVSQMLSEIEELLKDKFRMQSGTNTYRGHLYQEEILSSTDGAWPE